MWEIEFGDWTKTIVVANNISEAIKKAQSTRRKQKDNYKNRVQDITKAELIATED